MNLNATVTLPAVSIAVVGVAIMAFSFSAYLREDRGKVTAFVAVVSAMGGARLIAEAIKAALQ